MIYKILKTKIAFFLVFATCSCAPKNYVSSRSYSYHPIRLEILISSPLSKNNDIKVNTSSSKELNSKMNTLIIDGETYFYTRKIDKNSAYGMPKYLLKEIKIDYINLSFYEIAKLLSNQYNLKIKVNEEFNEIVCSIGSYSNINIYMLLNELALMTLTGWGICDDVIIFDRDLKNCSFIGAQYSDTYNHAKFGDRK